MPYLAEIRQLDSQLDHLNNYMGKIEQRIQVREGVYCRANEGA